MAHQKICLITPQEADLLRAGVAPACTAHRHISRNQAKVLLDGSRKTPWLEPTSYEAKQIWGVHGAEATRGILPDGSGSNSHVVLWVRREWQTVGSVKQWLPLGATKPQQKRTKTHLRKPIQYSLTQCRDNNQVQAGF